MLPANSKIIVPSISNDVECDATGDGKEPQKAQTDLHTDYTVRALKAKTITSQSVTPTRAIAAIGGLVAVKPMDDFGERRSSIPIGGLIDMTTRSPLTVVLTNFTNQPVLLQKPSGWQFLLTLAFVLVTFEICR